MRYKRPVRERIREWMLPAAERRAARLEREAEARMRRERDWYCERTRQRLHVEAEGRSAPRSRSERAAAPPMPGPRVAAFGDTLRHGGERPAARVQLRILELLPCAAAWRPARRASRGGRKARRSSGVGVARDVDEHAAAALLLAP